MEAPRPVKQELQKTNFIRYAPYVVVATLLVVGLPLLLAYGLSGPIVDLPFAVTTLAATALSVLLGRAGAQLWQSRPEARDLVFDDLTVWGFLRRVWHQRWVLTHAERLAPTGSGSRSLRGKNHLMVLKKLARALESGDPYTHGHSNRVARHAYMVALTLKLPKSTCEKIRLAAALHDVGKLHTPREILTKPGRLTDEQFEIVKRHPVDGAAMIAELQDAELTAIVQHHHERIDGTGYPRRISGDEIPLGARIISVVDTFDAITSRRPYRATRSHKDAIQILRKEAGSQLDASVVKAFIAYYTGRRGIRRWMSFTSGAPTLFDFSLAGLQQAAANAAVVAASAAVVAGSAVLPGLDSRAAASVQEAMARPPSGGNSRSILASADSEANTKSTRPNAGSKSEGVKNRARDRRPEQKDEIEDRSDADPQPETSRVGDSDESNGNDSDRGSDSGSDGGTGGGSESGGGDDDGGAGADSEPVDDDDGEGESSRDGDDDGDDDDEAEDDD